MKSILLRCLATPALRAICISRQFGGLSLGAGHDGLLYLVFGILLAPIIAAAAMAFLSVSVVTNALRLNRATL